MTNEKGTFIDHLLINKQEALKPLVDKAGDIFAIERETGRPIYKVDTKQLRQRDLLLLELFADELFRSAGLSKQMVDRKTLSERTGIKKTIITARFKDLRDEGLITTSESGDALTTKGITTITELVDELRRKREKDVEK